MRRFMIETGFDTHDLLHANPLNPYFVSQYSQIHSMRTRKTVLIQNALKREMFVPETYAAKIREELVDSLEDLVQKRLREVEGGFACCVCVCVCVCACVCVCECVCVPCISPGSERDSTCAGEG